MKKTIFLVVIISSFALTGCGEPVTQNQNTNQANTNQAPVAESKTRAEWQEILNWPEECNEPGIDLAQTSGVYQYHLNKQSSLILVLCFRAAYQDNYRLYHYKYSTSDVIALQLESFYENLDGNLEELYLDSFASANTYDDFSSRAEDFSVFEKAAGHGGCGYVADYKWNYTSEEYELTTFSGNFDCENPVDSDQWTVLYDVSTKCCQECTEAFNTSPVGTGAGAAQCGEFSTSYTWSDECQTYYSRNPIVAAECQ